MLRIIGDVHGRVQAYMELIKSAEYSVQLGDFGFLSEYNQLDWYLDQKPYNRNHHVIIPGNHDNYDHLPESALGNYGYRLIDQIGFFWIRGAQSIDRDSLITGVNWWHEEELTYLEMQSALEIYTTVAPSLMLTHECPEFLLPYITADNPFYNIQSSTTSRGLQACLDQHAPQLWIFGHHHRTCAYHNGQTVFLCLAELDYIDINTHFHYRYDEAIELIRQKCTIEQL